MIARIWHGVTPSDKADDYLEFVRETGLPHYRSIEGNQGAYILRRIDNGAAHFITLSFWDSLEAVKRFAGEDYEKAHYYDRDKEFLLEFEPTVEHYELFDD